jgi:hypothetical protein
MRASPASLILVAAAAAEAGAIDGAYHGTIGKLEVFARLEQAADGALRGRYFYARVGRDIELDGRVDGEQIAFVEHVAGKSTGRFSGRLGPGAIAGTWSSGSKKLPFSLAAVPRAELQPILVARKNGSTAADLPGGKRCKRDILYPELFGLVDAGVEQALNSKLRPEAAPCGATGEHSVQYQVHLNRSGILSLSLGASGYGEGAAHPYSELRSFNVVTRSGRALRWEDVFKAGAEETLKAKLEPMIEAAAASTPGADPAAKEILRQALAPPGADFFLEDRGVRFNAWGALPHAFQALAASQRFYLPYADLAPVLVTTGEAAGIWAR